MPLIKGDEPGSRRDHFTDAARRTSQGAVFEPVCRLELRTIRGRKCVVPQIVSRRLPNDDEIRSKRLEVLTKGEQLLILAPAVCRERKYSYWSDAGKMVFESSFGQPVVRACVRLDL